MHLTNVIKYGAPRLSMMSAASELPTAQGGRIDKLSSVSATLLACLGIGVSTFGVKQMMTEMKPSTRRHAKAIFHRH